MRKPAISETPEAGYGSSNQNRIDGDLSDGLDASDSEKEESNVEDEDGEEEDEDEEEEEEVYEDAVDGDNEKANGENGQNIDEDDEDDEDIDQAIAKADKPRNKKETTQKQRRQYLNQILNISTLEDLQLIMRKAFQEAQTTVAVHKRQLAIMRAVILRANTLGLTSDFNSFFCHLISKVLPMKKNVKAADRIVKFISSFFSLINPMRVEEEEDLESDIENSQEMEELYSLFVEKVLKFLLGGLDALNTTVRFRICHLLSHIIGNCGGIDEDLYETLSDELTTRIYDKDASVRIKAVTALACFQNDDRGSLSLAGKKLRFTMQNDLNSEVRRACLRNIEKNRFTEPFIVERARDVDTTNRRLVYSKILPGFQKITDINSANRNRLLEWGLRDRDATVRKAATNWLTETWMRDTNNDLAEFLERLNVTESDIAETAVRALLDKKPDIVNNLKLESDFFDNLTPSLALMIRVVFEYCHDNRKSDIIENLFMEAADFASLFVRYFRLRTENLLKISENREEIEKNPEFAIELGIIDPDEYNYIIMQLLKIAVDYDYSDEFGRSKMYSILRSTLSNNSVTEPILPLLMECLRKLAINERDFCQMTVEIINDLKDSEYERIMNLKKQEEDNRKAEEEALTKSRRRKRGEFDDENGEDSDTDEVDKLNAKVQRMLKEPDDDENDEDSDYEEYHSAMNDMSRQSIIEANKSRQEEIDQVSVLSPDIITDCLTITKCMLQLVFSPLRENMLLISLLDNFIVPCVNQRSEVTVRELALTCHGLCGLLDKEVAVSTMVVAGIFVTRSDHESFVVTGLKVIGDLLTIHGISILQSENQRSIDSMAVAKVFYRTLKDESKPEAQSIVAVTLFKLFLCGVINDDELFETTLLTYFNPKVNKNPALKQCLAFCIPTYSFSHENHQELIASIVYDTIERLYKDWDDIVSLNHSLEIKQPVTANFIIESLLYWTDPYNRALASEEEMESSSLHLDVGIQLMRLLKKYDYQNKTHKAQYKPIIRSLTKLTFTSKANIEKLRKFRECFDDDELCQGDLDEVLNSDLICKNSFLKCHTYIQECLAEAEDRERERLEKEAELVSQRSVKQEETQEQNKEDQQEKEDKKERINEEHQSEGEDVVSDTHESDALNPEAQSSMIIGVEESESEAEPKSDPSQAEVEPEVEDIDVESKSDSSFEVLGDSTYNDSGVKAEPEPETKKKKKKKEARVKKDVYVKQERKTSGAAKKKTVAREGRVQKPEHRNSSRGKKNRGKDKEESKDVEVSSSPDMQQLYSPSPPPVVSHPDTSEIILLDSD